MDCIVHGVAKSWTQLSDFPKGYFLAWQVLLQITIIVHISHIRYLRHGDGKKKKKKKRKKKEKKSIHSDKASRSKI